MIVYYILFIIASLALLYLGSMLFAEMEDFQDEEMKRFRNEEKENNE